MIIHDTSFVESRQVLAWPGEQPSGSNKTNLTDVPYVTLYRFVPVSCNSILACNFLVPKHIKLPFLYFHFQYSYLL